MNSPFDLDSNPPPAAPLPTSGSNPANSQALPPSQTTPRIPPQPINRPIGAGQTNVSPASNTQKPPRSISPLKLQSNLGGRGQFISGIFLIIAIVSLVAAAIAGWVFYFWLKD